jgi:hypothetical protein
MKQTDKAIFVNSSECAEQINEAVLNVISEGGFDVPVDNPFNGVDLWKEGQKGLVRGSKGFLYLAEGVRVAEEDGVVTVYRFEKQGVAQKTEISQPTAAQVEALIRVML